MKPKIKGHSASADPKSQENMRLIPEGKFFMGAEGWGEFESPVHEIHLDSYFIDEYPVTNEQFELFTKATGYKTTAELRGFAFGYETGQFKKIDKLSWKKYAQNERKFHPVILVSWEDAAAYAKWINKRLPTEAEWEKAARGGLNQKLYPWGNEEPTSQLCNFGKSTPDIPQTTEVRSFPKNGYGLYDMCGNVWNWCDDWFSESTYTRNNNSNPKGPKSGTVKVRRGASFNIIQTFRLRCSNRGAFDPKSCAINIGFRCAKDISNG